MVFRLLAKQLDEKLVEIDIDKSLIKNVNLSFSNEKKLDSLPWVTTGLFDLQVNGALGTSFNDPFASIADISKAIGQCVSHGMTGILATLVTTDRVSIVRSLELLERAREADPLVENVIEGYHIEGPAISHLDGYRGAHPEEHVRVPCIGEYRQWLLASNNRIKLVTVAPELPGVIDWIPHLIRDGITVAIGHTAANYEQIKQAVLAGAKLSTHLGNGCASSIHRHNNPIWAQLAEDGLFSSLITDGYHLSEPFVRTVLKCKKPGKIVLTCDSSPLAGLPPGIYKLWDKSTEIDSRGRVVIPNSPYLAGSGHFLDYCIGTALKMEEWEPSEIIKAASSIPREILGLQPRQISKGHRADLVLWKGPSLICSKVQEVCVSGRWFQSRNETEA